ncbi:phospholipase [Pyxidicoccus fallax]|uniref:Phospholipase n=1 Tax=Pyxidicoccus fallax TaxID=394095 RepID=A0A848LYL1_9BACT|nr:phospholipase [Pyxidicoccus fallax]NMO22622.1 phospholipase [Pyxidicoccus fallax]NPC84644.1 phospholipase [Pyxidicoccus fallax]
MGGRTARRVTTRLGELDCNVVDALAEGEAPQLAVVLCHGFGAPATDLVYLAPELMSLDAALAERVRFVFPGAPLTLAEWGMPHGRAWFHLPEAVMLRQMRDWDVFAREVPPGMPAARRAVMSVVEALSTSMKLPYGRIVLGGFSQGGMVTTDVALRLEEAPGGLCILSGTLTSEPEWRQKASARKGLPVFQAHGRYDDVLPFSAAERLRDVLTGSGLSVDFLPFDGPHTIAPEEMERLATFLVARLGGR